MDENWFLYKSKSGEAVFYYNTQTHEKRWANNWRSLAQDPEVDCSKEDDDEQKTQQSLEDSCSQDSKHFLRNLISQNNGSEVHSSNHSDQDVYNAMSTNKSDVTSIKTTMESVADGKSSRSFSTLLSVNTEAVNARIMDFVNAPLSVKPESVRKELVSSDEIIFSSSQFNCGGPLHQPFVDLETLEQGSEHQPSLLDDLFALDYCLSPTAVKSAESNFALQPCLRTKENKEVIDQKINTEVGKKPDNNFTSLNQPGHIYKAVKQEPEDFEMSKSRSLDNEMQNQKKSNCEDSKETSTEVPLVFKSENESESFDYLPVVKAEYLEPDFEVGLDDKAEDPDSFSIAEFLPNQLDSKNAKDVVFKCEDCGKIFPRKHNLSRHHMRVHKKEKKHACYICGRAFAEKSCLTKHIRMHTGVRPYPCTHCGHAFTQPQNLKKHVRTAHMKEKLMKDILKPHKCTICDKGFADKAHLHRHSLIHAGIKPYKCTVCNIMYRELHHLTRHLKCQRHKRRAAFPSCKNTIKRKRKNGKGKKENGLEGFSENTEDSKCQEEATNLFQKISDIEDSQNIEDSEFQEKLHNSAQEITDHEGSQNTKGIWVTRKIKH